MQREVIVSQLLEIHDEILFKNGEIDSHSGLVNGYNKKFATYLGIGDKYGEKSRILIVGLDIGSDETEGTIQSLKERSESIQRVTTTMNFHMAGTYFTALYLLKSNNKDYENFYEKVKFATIFPTIIKRYLNELPSENPLNYIAFTNFHKFVTPLRKSKYGSLDRKIFLQDVEMNLFLKEIEILNPEILFFQSTDFYQVIKNKRVAEFLAGKDVYVGYHPSKILPRLKYPGYYFTEYLQKL